MKKEKQQTKILLDFFSAGEISSGSHKILFTFQ